MHPTMRARSIVKAILPQGLVRFIQCCRYRGYLAHILYSRKARKYREQFAKANDGPSHSTIVFPAGCSIRVPPVPAEIRDAFEHFGWRDPDAIDESIGFMKAAAGKKTLWDIGALFGFFSLAFTLGEAGRLALAFEPNPHAQDNLKQCLRCNPDARIEIFDFALGLPAKAVVFQKGFHFIAAAGLETQSTGDLVQLETVSIDQLIARNFATPDMIKIDVEGHEFEVLQGAKNLLRSKKPLLSLEVHPAPLLHQGISPVALAQYLEESGYGFRNMQLKPVTQDFFKRRDTFRVLAM